jgi:hypothetical protein
VNLKCPTAKLLPTLFQPITGEPFFTAAKPPPSVTGQITLDYFLFLSKSELSRHRLIWTNQRGNGAGEEACRLISRLYGCRKPGQPPLLKKEHAPLQGRLGKESRSWSTREHLVKLTPSLFVDTLAFLEIRIKPNKGNLFRSPPQRKGFTEIR